MGEEDWSVLQANLEATIPVYDRINRFATFGQDQRWRRMVQDRLPLEGKILEVGCAQEFCRESQRPRTYLP